MDVVPFVPGWLEGVGCVGGVPDSVRESASNASICAGSMRRMSDRNVPTGWPVSGRCDSFHEVIGPPTSSPACTANAGRTGAR